MRPASSASGPSGRGERLQKFIARSGIASRRRAEKLIVAGRVRVNGRPATVLGTRVRPERDEVLVDGAPVSPGPARWVMLNKPAGYLTTRHDDRGRRTVYDLLPGSLRGLAHVGRLDQATQGLLLLTNDGEAAHRLTHPSRRVEREYRAWVVGTPSRRALGRLVAGVRLDDGRARAVRARVLESSSGRAGGSGVADPRGRPGSSGRPGTPVSATLQLVLTEGRKREVRRMCRAVGHPVRGLERVRFGPVRLADLARGAWRELTGPEVAALDELRASGV